MMVLLIEIMTSRSADRSHKEEEVLLLVSDYVDLVRDLIQIARGEWS